MKKVNTAENIELTQEVTTIGFSMIKFKENNITYYEVYLHDIFVARTISVLTALAVIDYEVCKIKLYE